MLNPQKIEQIIQQVQSNLPQGIKNLGIDVETKIKQALQAQLAKLDVVTREEFDVQTQVLLRTREKLNTLEQQVNQLLEQKNKTSHNE